MPTSFHETQKLTCPQCGQSFEAELWLIVDAAERPDLAAHCRDGRLHRATYPNGHIAALIPLLHYYPIKL